MGYSRGGFSSKIHAVTEAKGRPLIVEITPGQAADISQAESLLTDVEAEAVAADKAYDADALVEALLGRQINVVIPPKVNRKQIREYDREL